MESLIKKEKKIDDLILDKNLVEMRKGFTSNFFNTW